MITRKALVALTVTASMTMTVHAWAAAGQRSSPAGFRQRLTAAHAEAEGRSNITLPAGVAVARDLAYGPAPLQRFDVYYKLGLHGAPVLFMVHGGGWRDGDKAAASVVENKVTQWVPRGFVFVSVNYRLLPEASVMEQARDVASALAAAQSRIGRWGGDPARFVLVGHSAGAHLMALVASSSDLTRAAGAKPWLGTILLDSAALDVVQLMTNRHLPLYDAAFGSEPGTWRATSPLDVMRSAQPPLLAVCSSRRMESCPAAEEFVARAAALGTRASVLREDLSHRDINVMLGERSAYTTAVDDFLRSLGAR